MNRRSPVFAILFASVMGMSAGLLASPSLAQEGSADQPPGSSQTGNSSRGDSASGDSTSSVGELNDDPLYLAEVDRRMSAFADAKQRLRDAVMNQREIYLRYVNQEQRTPADKRAYLDQRLIVRERMDETYLAALDVIRIAGKPEPATFVATMVDHRLRNNIYDAETLEGATRLIDGGSTLRVLFHAAIRSAVAVGEFDMAKRLLDAIKDEELNKTDESLAYFLDEHKEMWAVEAKIREREAEEDRLPRVKLETTQGDVVVELFIDQAPSTVANFIQLVESGFYDGLDFHQVIDNLLALTGDPTGLGNGTSGKYLADEHERPDHREAFRGSLLMAKLPQGDQGDFVPDSASSQFAILFLPVATATEQQTVFGRVIEGMDVISRLRRLDPSKKQEKETVTQPPDRIIEATVLRRPEKLPEVKYFDPQTVQPAR